MNYDIKELKKSLIKVLEPKRYEHTIGVAYTAFAMALRFGADPEKALVAGLLHDCAKCYDNDKKFELCNKYGVKLTKVEVQNPFLIHAKLGSVMAKEKYGVKNKEILSAIKYHTTGKPNMNLLEKIIFSADYIEPNRKKILGLDEIREVIFDDLDMGIYIILENTLKHLNNKEMIIDSKSQKAYEFYKELIENRK